MEFVSPDTLDAALQVKCEDPDAVPIIGGTDVMVELNFDRRRPGTLLDLTRVAELRQWDTVDGHVRLGAGVTYTRVIEELGTSLPGLAMASRTVGSPQIRNRGTVGGNLGAASPAGDSHPPLLACGAEVELCSVRGTRRIPAADFYVGVKQHAAEPDELVTAVWVPVADGPQQFCKIGTRNAMVIAVCAFAVALHPRSRSVGTGLGSAAPTPRSAPRAEAFLADALGEAGLWESRASLPEPVVAEFADRVAAAAAPIDDVRGSAPYRQHSLTVMARRALGWAWTEYTQTVRS